METITKVHAVEPYTGTTLNKTGKELYEIGAAVLRANKVSLLILAGGQATRLNSDGPKGCYTLPEIKTSLFQIHAENVCAINKLFDCRIKFILMISAFTHEKTVEHFMHHNFFGLHEEDVMFVIQNDTICYTFNDQPIQYHDGYAMSPDGNGSVFSLLKERKVYDKLGKTEYINIISVDNALARVCDPLLIGLAVKNNLECASKCVHKKDGESVGVFVKDHGKIVIKEYSENRNVEHVEGNMCNHIFSISFMKRVGDEKFPVHKAYKKIPYTENGKVIKPQEKNGYKNEYFIFDCFEFTNKNGLLKVPRELEFAPVKNNDSENCDNPKTAVDALFKRSKIMLENVNAKINNYKVLIFPSKSIFGENLDEFKGKTFEEDTMIS